LTVDVAAGDEVEPRQVAPPGNRLIGPDAIGRRLFEVLVLYLPFEGLVALANYPSHVAKVARDGLVLLIFAVWGRRLLSVWRGGYLPKVGTALLAIYAGVCLIQAINPRQESAWVALVGARTRLFYLPLLAAAILYVRTRADIVRLSALVASPIIISAVVATYQVSVGPDVVSQWGPGFANSIWEIGEFRGRAVYRPGGTFSFVSHFGGYLTFSTLLTAAAIFATTNWRWLALLLAALASQTLAAVVITQRLTMIFLCGALPAVLAAGVAPPVRKSLRRAALWRCGAAGVTAAAGAAAGVLMAPAALYRLESTVETSTTGQLNVPDTIMVSLGRLALLAREGGLWGHGLGSASPGSRYVVSQPDEFLSIPYESLIGQLTWELGLPGTLSFLALLAVVIVVGIKESLKSSDEGVRPFVVAITVFNVFIALTVVTYALVSFAPIGIYFWMLAGLLMRLRRPLEGPAGPLPSGEDEHLALPRT
jgi:hypothetical protein